MTTPDPIEATQERDLHMLGQAALALAELHRRIGLSSNTRFTVERASPGALRGLLGGRTNRGPTFYAGGRP